MQNIKKTLQATALIFSLVYTGVNKPFKANQLKREPITSYVSHPIHELETIADKLNGIYGLLDKLVDNWQQGASYTDKLFFAIEKACRDPKYYTGFKFEQVIPRGVSGSVEFRENLKWAIRETHAQIQNNITGNRAYPNTMFAGRLLGAYLNEFDQITDNFERLLQIIKSTYNTYDEYSEKCSEQLEEKSEIIKISSDANQYILSGLEMVKQIRNSLTKVKELTQGLLDGPE